MRKILINIAMFASVGGVLGSAGVLTNMWQFWIVLGCTMVIQINSEI